MKISTIDKGIIDKENNPFVHESWIEQNYGFTSKRQGQFKSLFGQGIEKILSTNPKNENRYVAFIAIRWGFACLLDKKLTPTEKWFNRKTYNGHGLPLKHNTMENILDIESIKSCTNRDPWSLGNDILYKMCADYFKHDSSEKIIAKVWLIGRSYAVALERRKNKIQDYESDKFYTEVVVNAFQLSKLDKIMDDIKINTKLNPDTLIKTIELHFYLTKLLNEITELNKRSFSSKYLHFHMPNLFYIYDSRATKALRKFKINIPDNLKLSVTDKKFDKEYSEFACKCFVLTNQVKELFGIELTPRQIDNLLLERL